MIYLYQQIFYRPALNLLIFLYQTVAFHDFGLAIIFVTLLIRFILYPLFHKGARQQMLMQRIQPHVKKIQETHKDDRERQAKELMALYKEHGVSPFSGFLLVLVQLPILIALYRIFLSGLGHDQLTNLYSFVPAPAMIHSTLLGIVDLSKKNFILVLAAAVAQYFQARLAIYRPSGDMRQLSAAEKMGRQMAFLGPLITVFIFYNLPAAVGLYWFVTSLFSIGQQILANRSIFKSDGNSDGNKDGNKTDGSQAA